jgi:hypothetical protein
VKCSLWPVNPKTGKADRRKLPANVLLVWRLSQLESRKGKKLAHLTPEVSPSALIATMTLDSGSSYANSLAAASPSPVSPAASQSPAPTTATQAPVPSTATIHTPSEAAAPPAAPPASPPASLTTTAEPPAPADDFPAPAPAAEPYADAAARPAHPIFLQHTPLEPRYTPLILLPGKKRGSASFSAEQLSSVITSQAHFRDRISMLERRMDQLEEWKRQDEEWKHKDEEWKCKDEEWQHKLALKCNS